MEEIRHCAKGLGTAAEALFVALAIQSTTAAMLVVGIMFLG